MFQKGKYATLMVLWRVIDLQERLCSFQMWPSNYTAIMIVPASFLAVITAFFATTNAFGHFLSKVGDEHPKEAQQLDFSN